MAGSGTEESEDLGKKKAKTGDFGDGPSNLSSLSSSRRVKEWMAEGGMSDGAAERGGEEELEVAVEEGSHDPLAVFGSGIMMTILGKLDAPSVALARLVSRGWLAVASTDKIWGTKVAPEYWRNLDPQWGGTGAPMRRYFHPDGSITADPDDQVWGGHESSYTVVTGLFADGKIRQHYVRINRWPQMSVHRKPDWSWVLSNHLYCYTSIPDADDKEEGTGPFSPLF